MLRNLKSNIRPFAIFIIALAFITTTLLSSCSVINGPGEKQTQVIDPTEIPAGTADQKAKDEEKDSINTDDSTETVGLEPFDADDENSTDPSGEDKAAAEDASGNANVNTGSEAREFDAAKDMQLRALKADMLKEEVDRVMKSELVDSTTRNEYGMKTEIRTYKDGTVIHLLYGKIYSISVKSPDYTTPRGLKTGDTEETLQKLYGEPTTVEGNKWIYSARGYDLFFVTVENGIVTEIMISQVL